MDRLTFKKTQRIVSNSRFREIIEKKWRFSNSLLTVYVAPNEIGYPRLGVTVGKRFGKANMRNRLKRLVRETFRLNQHNIPANLDYIVMYNPLILKKKNIDMQSLSMQTVNDSFLAIMDKAKQKLDLT